MADKKSFVIYDNWATMIANLPSETAGELIKMICAWQTGHEYRSEDQIVKAIFSMIEPKMREDAESCDDVRQKRKDAGKTGSEKRWGKQEDSKTWQTDSKGMAEDSKGMASEWQTDSKTWQTDSKGMAEDSKGMASDNKTDRQMPLDADPALEDPYYFRAGARADIHTAASLRKDQALHSYTSQGDLKASRIADKNPPSGTSQEDLKAVGKDQAKDLEVPLPPIKAEGIDPPRNPPKGGDAGGEPPGDDPPGDGLPGIGSSWLLNQRFEEFWEAYPRKQGKGAARKAWRKIRPGAALHGKIMAAVRENAARNPQWLRDGGQFIPNPATWLNQERWEDGPPEGGGGFDANKYLEAMIRGDGQ